MLAVYLVPTVQRALVTPYGTLLEQSSEAVEVARTCAGWSHTYLSGAARMPAYCLMAVEATDHTPLENDARCWRLALATRLLTALDDPTVVNLPQGVRDRLAAIGITGVTSATRRQLWDLLRARLEPALHDRSFELVPRPEPHGSISDQFTGAGTLGSGWTEGHHLFGSSDIERVSDQANQTGAGDQFSQMVRTESAFPADQWASMDVLLVASGDKVSAGTRGGAKLNAIQGYFLYQLTETAFDFRLIDFGDGNTILTLLDSASGLTLTNGNSYPVKIESVGTTHTLWINGVQRTNPSDSYFASGKPTIIGTASGGVNGIGDNFESIDAVAVNRLLKPNPLRPAIFAPGIAR